MKKIQLTIFFTLCCYHLAWANDTTGSVAAGGIQFAKTSAIKMQSEVLSISSEQVKVDYVFKNLTDKDVTTTVIFPLPASTTNGIDAADDPWDDEVEALDVDTDKTKTAQEKIMPLQEFTVIVNGQPVKHQVKIQAQLNGKDITAILKKAGIPLNPDIAGQDDIGEDNLDMDDGLLPVAQYHRWLKKAKQLGFLDKQGNPLWKKQIFYYWTQTFPAHQTVAITHEYKPVSGFTPGTPTSCVSLLQKEAHPPEEICLSSGIDNGDHIYTNGVEFNEWSAKNGGVTEEVQYILTTGANWAGPIENFTLILRYPANAMAVYVPFYGSTPAKLTKTPGLTQIALKHFTPKQDLRILFIEPINE